MYTCTGGQVGWWDFSIIFVGTDRGDIRTVEHRRRTDAKAVITGRSFLSRMNDNYYR